MSLTAAIPAARLDELRQRSTWTLVAGVALGSTGHIAAVTVASIVAQQLGGTALWSGVTGATVVLGAAGGAVVLSRDHDPPRPAGRAVGRLRSSASSAPSSRRRRSSASRCRCSLVGTFLIGFGNASNQLSRYAAADMYPDSRRASAIGLVVWGATAGAIIGPNLVAPAGAFAAQLGLPELAGPYFVPIVFVGAAALLSWALLRPDPYELADRDGPPEPRRAGRVHRGVARARCSPARTCRSRSSRWSRARS